MKNTFDTQQQQIHLKIMIFLILPYILWTRFILNRPITLHCSAVQCSAVQCNAVQCSTVHCSAVQGSAMQCNAVQFSAV